MHRYTSLFNSDFVMHDYSNLMYKYFIKRDNWCHYNKVLNEIKNIRVL